MLHNIRTASPCSADWEKMQGDDHMRSCTACQLNVYNFSEMTESEIRQLLQTDEGRRLCGRFYRRKDGTILTRNCPVGLRAVVRRLSRIAGAVLSFMTPGFASAQSQGYVNSTASSATVEVHVTDVLGAVIQGAEVTLSQSGSDKVIQAKTDADGRLLLYRNAGGNYILTISSPGFKTFASEVNLTEGKVLSINAPLNVANPIDVVQVGQIATAPGIEPVPIEVPVIGLEMVVVDKQGAVLANADVVLKKKGGKQETRGKTDANGKVFFPTFSSGDYVVKVSAFGNQVYKKQLQLRNGETTSIQTRAETLEVVLGAVVTTEAPLIDTIPVSHFPLNPE